MQERSEEQTLAWLLELENDGQAERRVELTGERFLSLIHDPDSRRAYVLQHGVGDREGGEIPPGTEFYEYETRDEAERAFAEMLGEAVAEGEVVEEDSTEDLGALETSGAEVREMYSDEDTDPLIQPEEPDDPVLEPADDVLSPEENVPDSEPHF